VTQNPLVTFKRSLPLYDYIVGIASSASAVCELLPRRTIFWPYDLPASHQNDARYRDALFQANVILGK